MDPVVSLGPLGLEDPPGGKPRGGDPPSQEPGPEIAPRARAPALRLPRRSSYRTLTVVLTVPPFTAE
jgi:hypothetical protein